MTIIDRYPAAGDDREKSAWLRRNTSEAAPRSVASAPVPASLTLEEREEHLRRRLGDAVRAGDVAAYPSANLAFLQARCESLWQETCELGEERNDLAFQLRELRAMKTDAIVQGLYDAVEGKITAEIAKQLTPEVLKLEQGLHALVAQRRDYSGLMHTVARLEARAALLEAKLAHPDAEIAYGHTGQ